MKYAYLFIVALSCYLFLDAIWLKLSLNRIYKPQIGHLFADKFNIYPAMVFYLLFSFALIYFCVIPHLDASSIKHSLIAGLIFGAVTYGTYDLTNQSTLKNWPTIITIIDTLCGSLVCALVSVLCYVIFRNKI